MNPSSISCAPRLELTAVPGIPIVQPGDDVGALVCNALAQNGVELRGDSEQRDVLVVTSKLFSRAEDRFVDLATIADFSDAALELARKVQKDPRVCELILRESSEVSRAAPNVLIVRHKLGFVSANAGVDESNGRSEADGRGPWVLLLPRDPDASARAVRAAVRARFGVDVGVVISDSHGRPFRLGSVGVAIGVAGVPALWDHRGRSDLHGRPLEITITALADQIAAAADLVAGQADEGRPLVLVRGLRFAADEDASTSQLLRPIAQDLYR
jgi:coenzyme F420-0:L-glutamate ligase/coenzyme F420-1:gamma-L-glutamate ligase